MTDLITRDPNDTGEIPPLPGEHHARLYVGTRTTDLRHRIVARRPDATGEHPKLIAQPYGLTGASLVPYHPANGTIVDTLLLPLGAPPAPNLWPVTTLYVPLQDPPTGPRPTLPPEPPAPAKAEQRPRGFRPAHRRAAPLRLVASAIVGLTLAAFASGWMAHALVAGVVR